MNMFATDCELDELNMSAMEMRTMSILRTKYS